MQLSLNQNVNALQEINRYSIIQGWKENRKHVPPGHTSPFSCCDYSHDPRTTPRQSADRSGISYHHQSKNKAPGLLNHGEEEEATDDLLPLRGSGGGEGQSSRSQGLSGPTTTREAQETMASTAATSPEQEQPGHAGSGGHGSLLAISISTSPLLPNCFQQLPGGQSYGVTRVPPRSSCAHIPRQRRPSSHLRFLGQSQSVQLLLSLHLLHNQGQSPATAVESGPKPWR